MAPTIKAIFFDLDGTLVDKKTEQVPISAQKALWALRGKGVKLFISSGRPPVWANLLKKQFDFPFDGKVLLNGQYCVDQDEVPIFKNPLTQQQLGSILQWLERNPETLCTFMETDYAYTNIPGPNVKRPVEPVTRCLDHETYQISPQVGPEADAVILAQVEDIKSARWNDTSTDLIPGSGGEECMAFGDGANDIEMLEYAGVGIAMGNGGDAVKQAADYVTTDVDKDGILNALRHFGVL